MAYTDLIKIDRPLGTELSPIAYLNAKAYTGEVVEIFVYIKNQHSSAIGIKPRAIVNGSIEVVFTVPWMSSALPGYTYYFTGRFTMPNADANIRAESYYYGVDGQWHFEDYQTRTINLETIETKRLVINRNPTVGGTVTVSPAPTTGTTYDGYYPKNTTVYVTAHPSSGYRFKNWSDELSGTNPSGSVYMSESRTITANFEVIPKATIVSKVLEYSGLSVSLPAPGVIQGTSARLRVGVRNDSTANQELAIAWTIVDPDYTTVQAYRNTEYFWTAPGNTQQFVGGSFTLSKVGTYRVRIQAFVKTDLTTPVDDTGDIVLCTTVVQTIPTTLHSVTASTTKPTADYGATVPYVLGYKYKGEAQGGTLKVEVGAGAWPNFTPVAVVTEVPYSFIRQTAETARSENRTFTVPSTLTRGQKYNIRVTLATADGLTDDDTFYSAFTVLDVTVPSTDLQGLVIIPTYREYALGDTYQFSISYKYKGVAQSGTKSIVIRKLTSDVYTYVQTTVQYERKDTLTTISSDESIVLPKSLEPGQVYSLYMRLTTSDGKDTSDTKGTAFKIASTEIPEDPGVGTYRKVKDHIYPYAETYRGPCTEATVEITIPLAQLPGADWLSEKVVDEFEGRVAENGAHMLQIVVHEREHGLTSKDYMLIARATKPKEVAGQAYTPQGIVSLAYITPQLGLAIWAVIILGVLVAFGFIISAVVPSVREGVWGEGGFVETVVGIVGLIGDILPMMVIMIMLMLVMEQTREVYEPVGAPPRPKPVTEAAVKAAKWVGREAVELAGKGLEEAKKLVAEARKEWKEASEEKKAEKVEELRRAEEREAESRRKLQEAKVELRRRREERGGQ